MYQRKVVRLNLESAREDLADWPQHATKHSFTMKPVARVARRAFRIADAIVPTIGAMAFTLLLLIIRVPQVADALQPAQDLEFASEPSGYFIEGDTLAQKRYLGMLFERIGLETTPIKSSSKYVARIEKEVTPSKICRDNVRDTAVRVVLRIKEGDQHLDPLSTVTRRRLLPCDPGRFKEVLGDFIREILLDMQEDMYFKTMLVANEKYR